ncbi:MAG: anti-sigma factor [Bacteroidota bacterium]
MTEAYALGLTNPQETAEMEAAMLQYPEVAAEVEAIRSALEGYARAHSQAPPANLKNKILARMQAAADEAKLKSVSDTGQAEPANTVPAGLITNIPQDGQAKKTETPAFISSNGGMPPTQAAATEGAKVRSINAPAIPPVTTETSFLPLLIAASVLLMLSLGTNLYLYSSLGTAQQQLAEASKRNSVLAQENDVHLTNFHSAEAEISRAHRQMAMINDMETKKIKLAGFPVSPTSAVMVYYNPKVHKAMLNVMSLPEVGPEEDYQLWAMVDGKPMDMGVIHADHDMHEMDIPPTIKAEAFAITMEKKGGSPVPTLTKIYVMGKVS